LSVPQTNTKSQSATPSELFSVLEPRAEPIPVVVEIPHAGLGVDPLAAATLAAPVASLGRDADLYVDALYVDATDLGATVLVSHASRYVCDLNRAETDVDGVAVQGAHGNHMPHGLVWHQTTEAQPALNAPLSPLELERRLSALYRPYHQALRRILSEHRERFGYVILLAAHSMPSAGRSGHTDPGSSRADVVPGSRGFTTAAAQVIRCPDVLARQRGWTVQHDTPYRGGFTTGHYGQPSLGFHAVQVELNRRLYMDEVALTKRHPGFTETRVYCRELVAALGRIDPR
jgi:N-formylglutamate deformylase